MKWSVQVVKPSTHNLASTSVLVQIDCERYLFNCGEGTQRLGFENKIRMSKVNAIFLTRVDWETMGGLPGMLLTVSDGGVSNLTISGGPNLTHALAATRHFILRRQLGLRVQELQDNGSGSSRFEDKNIKVTPVHIYPSRYKPATASSSESKEAAATAAKIREHLIEQAFGKHEEPEPETRTAAASNGEKGKKKKRQVEPQKKKGYYSQKCEGAALESLMEQLEQKEVQELNGKKRSRSPEENTTANADIRPSQLSSQHLPQTKPLPVSLCYICQGPDVPGKFDVQAAQALGLKQGPLYGKLTRGQSVTAPDGTIVHPSQCVGPTRLGRLFIVVDCPNTDYIESLVNHQKFFQFFDQDSPMKERLLLVIHSLGHGVAQDVRYKEWMTRFPGHVQHMISAPEFVADDNMFQRHLRVQASMAAIDPRTYVLPQASKVPNQPLSQLTDSPNAVVPASLMVYEIEPQPRLDTSLVRKLDTADGLFAEAKSNIKGVVASTTENDEVDNTDRANELVVCPIGTGSSVPSIYRNVSANVVSIPGYGGVVLDCGESTVSLLKRFLGYPQRNIYNTRIRQNYIEFVTSLKLLYISHMHADHHLGAILLLKEWAQLAKLSNSRMTVLGPARFWTWLKDYSGVEDIGIDRLDFINCHDIRVSTANLDTPNENRQLTYTTQSRITKLKEDLGLSDVSTCGVIHCPWAYGLSLTHQRDNWKLVYSGDTRPCANLVTLGLKDNQRPTILLHEATHSDDLIEDAKSKRHTTVSEAVAMAVGMRAENLLMTHFSQRCLSLPQWNLKNIQSVSVSRYGQLATTGDDICSKVVDQVEKDEEIEEYDYQQLTTLDNDLRMTEREAALLDDQDDSDVEDKETPQISGCLQQTVGDLNIATAFDLSVYAASDIARYKRSTRQLRRAMRKELLLLKAEEEEEEEGSKDVAKKTLKSKGK